MTLDVANHPDIPVSRTDIMDVLIRTRLSSTGYPLLRCIRWDYRDGTVMLRGKVSSYYLKQLAQSVLIDCPGIQRVVSLLEVLDNRTAK